MNETAHVLCRNMHGRVVYQGEIDKECFDRRQGCLSLLGFFVKRLYIKMRPNRNLTS